MWFVPPGTPHAIGAGVFILEVQEPSDFSIVLETRGFPVDRDDAHLALGWDVTIDAVDRHPLSEADVESLHGSWRVPGSILPAAADEFFWAETIDTERFAAPDLPPTFSVGVVTAGRGTVRTEGGELAVRAGETFALPAAAVAGARFEATGRLEVIVCGGAPGGPT